MQFLFRIKIKTDRRSITLLTKCGSQLLLLAVIDVILIFAETCIISLFCQVVFDPFVIRYSQQWKSVMDRFNREVVAIENEAKMFIEESSQSLRSAEGAFDMLLKFKHIRSREAIKDQMMQKFRDILAQYQKEVDTVDNLSVCSKLSETVPAVTQESPPCCRVDILGEVAVPQDQTRDH